MEHVFLYEDKLYVVVGEDVAFSKIECQTIPYDTEFYWFKVIGEDKVIRIDYNSALGVD